MTTALASGSKYTQVHRKKGWRSPDLRLAIALSRSCLRYGVGAHRIVDRFEHGIEIERHLTHGYSFAEFNQVALCQNVCIAEGLRKKSGGLILWRWRVDKIYFTQNGDLQGR